MFRQIDKRIQALKEKPEWDYVKYLLREYHATVKTGIEPSSEEDVAATAVFKMDLPKGDHFRRWNYWIMAGYEYEGAEWKYIPLNPLTDTLDSDDVTLEARVPIPADYFPQVLLCTRLKDNQINQNH